MRRAAAQIEALFDRKRTEVFPPPGPDRRDSFFARTVSSAEKPARLYVGLASPGKGPKLIFLRVLLSLLAAAQKEADAGAEADPYLSALCYFNALRELGGARRIVEDEVMVRLASYGDERRRVVPPDQPFANRRLREVLELTSRENTDKVAEAKERLAKDAARSAGRRRRARDQYDLRRPRHPAPRLDGRAGTTEGRRRIHSGDEPRWTSGGQAGLVLALLNVHKPRDRLHYEGFRQFHACFYRAVEATSVTPWAARALDRALAAVVVAAARHLIPSLTPDGAAGDIVDYKTVRADVLKIILDRAPAAAVVGGHGALTQAVDELLDAWEKLASDRKANAENLPYGYPKQRALLHDPLDPLLDSLDPLYRHFQGRSLDARCRAFVGDEDHRSLRPSHELRRAIRWPRIPSE